jgi:hypothetical protein
MVKTVQIILRKNDLHLVEWKEQEMPHRAWVTPDMIAEKSENGKTATVKNPIAGIPYGMDWSPLISINATPRDFDRELKRVGIWTVQDLHDRPNEARSALQSVYGMDMAALLMAVKAYESE